MGPLWETYSHNQSIFRALAGLHSDSASDVLRSLVGGPRGSLDPASACHSLSGYNINNNILICNIYN